MAFVLHTLPERFIIEKSLPPLSQEPGDFLQIDRVTGEIERYRGALQLNRSAYSQHIDGLLGSITLLRGRYLIVITSSRAVANIEGHDIRLVLDTAIIPYSANKFTSDLSSEQINDEQKYLELLVQVLKTAQFHFSYDFDLTLSLQQIATIRKDPNKSRLPIALRADERFFWNHYMAQEFLSSGVAEEFLVVVMNGYVFSRMIQLKDHSITFIMISRRSHQRSGKRFIMRGADEQGHVANFAETEQIIYVNELKNRDTVDVFSFLQTRGSIPLLWTQPITLKYAPKITLFTHEQSKSASSSVSPSPAERQKQNELAFRKHFEFQVSQYGRQVCVSLVNGKGGEGTLTQAYQQETLKSKNPNLRYVFFDFHRECRKMKYENIQKLVESLREEFSKMGYFHARLTRVQPSNNSSVPTTFQYEVLSRQEGAFRTNCIDCLDRTNVVQSVFAHRVLEAQLVSLGILAPQERSNLGSPSFQSMFQNVWANNADAMSIQYSGTGALKTDYTRTGKRSHAGAIQDGVNSLMRYYYNNFCDGTYQDAVDLFLGIFVPSKNDPSPFSSTIEKEKPDLKQKNVSTHFLSVLLVFVSAALIGRWLLPFVSPAPTESSAHSDTQAATAPSSSWFGWISSPTSWSLSSNLFLISTLYLSASTFLLFKNGRKFTNRPRFRLLKQTGRS